MRASYSGYYTSLPSWGRRFDSGRSLIFLEKKMTRNQKANRLKKENKIKILISAHQEEVEVVLKKGEVEIDKIALNDDKNLSSSLLPAIDKILKKNKINSKEVDKIEAKTKKTRLTSARIIKTVAKTGSYCLTEIKN